MLIDKDSLELIQWIAGERKNQKLRPTRIKEIIGNQDISLSLFSDSH